MKRKTILFWMVALSAGYGCSCATGGKAFFKGAGTDGSYQLDVVVHGSCLPVYEHRGQSHIAGQMGDRYVVRVHNRSPRRVEAVISVDGRDVIDGTPADTSKRGYIIEPYSFADVDGWRTSMDTVAAFRFTTVSDSYTSRMGTPGEVGFIRVAIFQEKERYQPPRPPYIHPTRKDSPGDWEAETDGSMQEFKSADAPRERNLGTRFGENRYSSVSETSFERDSSSPLARLSIRYDDAEGLCARGLAGFCQPQHPPYYPEERPIHSDRQFADPPPGWEHFRPWY